MTRPLTRQPDLRYRRDANGRQRWIGWPISTTPPTADIEALVVHAWPKLLAMADALDPPSIPSSNEVRVLSPAEMRRLDAGAALWRPGWWWIVVDVREQTPDDVTETALVIDDEEV